MRKQIFLTCLLTVIAFMPSPASGQQAQAILRIVKSEDGAVKTYDLQGNEIQKTSTTAENPACAQTTLTQTSKEAITSLNNSTVFKGTMEPKTMIGTSEMPSDSDVTEDNEPDNLSSSNSFTVVAPGPNLTYIYGSGYWGFSPSFQLNVYLTIVNDGTVTAGSSVLGIYLSADLDISASDHKVGDLPVFSLPPGAMSYKTFTSAGPLCLPDPTGSWYVLAVIDETNAVAESNETDNIYTPGIPFYVEGCCSIIVTSPNGGEVWDEGSTQVIRWTSVNASGNVKVSYSLDSGASWTTIHENMPDNHSVTWIVPQFDSDRTHCRIKIEDVDPSGCSDISDADFTIRNMNLPLETDVNPPGSGSVGRNPNKAIYYLNDSVQLTATAASGYRFDHWGGDLSGNDNPVNLIMDGGKSITAFFAENSASEYLMVTNCDDAGPGSLRETLLMANTHEGPDTILFDIPEGAPGYQADAGVWVIQPRSELPRITDGQLLIYGSSQSAFVGRDTNPYGPEIVLDGHQAGQDAYGFHVAASDVSIYGLTINHYDNVGIWMDSVNVGYIGGCYIGADYRGLETAPNGWGICIGNRCRHITVAPADTIRNIITGNLTGGILVSDSSHAINILGNIIGLDRTSKAAPGNSDACGLCIQEHCDSVIVLDNRIGGNDSGLLINNSVHNTIQSNWIGISPETLDRNPGEPVPETGNRNDGINISGESTDNLISKNIILRNGGSGIGIYGEQPIYNRISQNCIAQNGGPGISYTSAGANQIPAPRITHAANTSVSGTAIPGATIEIYTDSEDEGQQFQGETQSGADGHYRWTGIIQGSLPNITAIAIDAGGSTSSFSAAFVTAVEEPNKVSAPCVFSLEQNYPNPFNPETVISYTIPSISRVRLTVYDVLGKEVVRLVNEVKRPGVYRAIFNGDHYPNGLYLYSVEAGGHILMQKMMLLK
jgi:hypothetical protein